jgi:hypothetical protein
VQQPCKAETLDFFSPEMSVYDLSQQSRAAFYIAEKLFNVELFLFVWIFNN